MKPTNMQQEVLVLTSTVFTKRTYLNKDTSDTEKNLLENQLLKDDCSNGRLNDRLPEAFALADPNAEMYIHNIREEQHFLILEMGEHPSEFDLFYSIDPYNFMTLKFFN